MTELVHPSFFYLQIPMSIDMTGYFAEAAPLADSFGGRVLATVSATAVECLETGTPAASVFLVGFEQSAQAKAFWNNEQHQGLIASLDNTNGLVALLTPGLPYNGIPDAMEIPTLASVQPPEDRGPRAFMIIQGSVTDEERIDQYREILLPMIAAQGAYYIAFEATGGVQVLMGEWLWEIFVISRWPDHAAGHKVWYSERYQTKAIPARTGAGTFQVHYFNGTAG
jgi:uncharacterized protein (DUF1330 family)